MTKENPFRKAIANRQQIEPDELELPPAIAPPAIAPPAAASLTIQPKQDLPSIPSPPAEPLEPRKRGRPATGKRSDDAWIGRTFYIQRETDLDAEGELLNLKRQGVELDKSELVDKLLSAWVQWRKGENIDFLLGEISPFQNSEKV